MTNVKIISCATDAYKLNADALTEENYNKLPRQCKVIVDILNENGGELNRADLIGKLQEATETIITVGEGDKAVQKYMGTAVKGYCQPRLNAELFFCGSDSMP